MGFWQVHRRAIPLQHLDASLMHAGIKLTVAIVGALFPIPIEGYGGSWTTIHPGVVVSMRNEAHAPTVDGSLAKHATSIPGCTCHETNLHVTILVPDVKVHGRSAIAIAR